jgi:hypothetical protein
MRRGAGRLPHGGATASLETRHARARRQRVDRARNPPKDRVEAASLTIGGEHPVERRLDEATVLQDFDQEHNPQACATYSASAGSLVA